VSANAATKHGEACDKRYKSACCMGQRRILFVTIGHIVADRSAGFEPKLGVDLREASVMGDQMGDRESERERARPRACVRVSGLESEQQPPTGAQASLIDRRLTADKRLKEPKRRANWCTVAALGTDRGDQHGVVGDTIRVLDVTGRYRVRAFFGERQDLQDPAARMTTCWRV
jgi:hypothetical protein